MGMLIPTIWPQHRKFYKTLLLAAFAVIAAEILQVLILAGSCDVDDLILNLLGTAMGYPVHRLFIR